MKQVVAAATVVCKRFSLSIEIILKSIEFGKDFDAEIASAVTITRGVDKKATDAEMLVIRELLTPSVSHVLKNKMI